MLYYNSKLTAGWHGTGVVASVGEQERFRHLFFCVSPKHLIADFEPNETGAAGLDTSYHHEMFGTNAKVFRVPVPLKITTDRPPPPRAHTWTPPLRFYPLLHHHLFFLFKTRCTSPKQLRCALHPGNSMPTRNWVFLAFIFNSLVFFLPLCFIGPGGFAWKDRHPHDDDVYIDYQHVMDSEGVEYEKVKVTEENIKFKEVRRRKKRGQTSGLFYTVSSAAEHVCVCISREASARHCLCVLIAPLFRSSYTSARETSLEQQRD